VDRLTCSVAGQNAKGVAEAAAKLAGVSKVLLADDAQYANQLAETMSALIIELAGKYDAVVSPASVSGKNFMPRVAAGLDVAQVSEVVSVDAPDTFTRARSMPATRCSRFRFRLARRRCSRFARRPSRRLNPPGLLRSKRSARRAIRERPSS
jgi:electron transfer flavoprotein alpha subunit